MKHILTNKIFEAKKPKVYHTFTGPLSQEQIDWLDSCIDKQKKGIWRYNTNTKRVDVDGHIKCQNQKLTDFHGISFGDVTGDFRCGGNKLDSTSLIHFPRTIGGSLQAWTNKLTTLENGPLIIKETCNLNKNKLTTLKGIASEIKDLHLKSNNLTSLKYSPKTLNSLDAISNKITDFDGAPTEIIDRIDLTGNPFKNFKSFGSRKYKRIVIHSSQIESFKGMDPINNYIEYLIINFSQLSNLKGIPSMPNCELDIRNNNLKSLEGITKLKRLYLPVVDEGEYPRSPHRIDWNTKGIIEGEKIYPKLFEPIINNIEFVNELYTELNGNPIKLIKTDLYKNFSDTIKTEIEKKFELSSKELTSIQKAEEFGLF